MNKGVKGSGGFLRLHFDVLVRWAECGREDGIFGCGVGEEIEEGFAFTTGEEMEDWRRDLERLDRL